MTDLFDGHGSTTPAPKKAPKLYPIFHGARRGTCSGPTCGQSVYWDARYKFPVSADCEGGEHPTAGVDGKGVSHFTNCSDVGQFGKGRKRG